LQLCAQALCLEEMLGELIPRGAIYYHALRRREEMHFDESLRQRTEAAIEAIRQMLQAQHLPEAPNDARCPNCSLVHACLPTVIGEPARMRGLQGALYHIWESD
jgi:CRISPR-associated exonuclease Cas4